MFSRLENSRQSVSNVSASAGFLMNLNEKYRGNLVLTHNTYGFAIQKISAARGDVNCLIINDPETADELGFVAGIEYKLWADYRNRKNPFADTPKHVAAVSHVHRSDKLVIGDTVCNRDRLMAVVNEGDCCYIMLKNGSYKPVSEDELRDMVTQPKNLSAKTWKTVTDDALEHFGPEARLAREHSAIWNTFELAVEFREFMDDLWAHHDGLNNPEIVEDEAVEMFEEDAIAMYKKAKTMRVRAAKLNVELASLRMRYKQVKAQPKSANRDAMLNSLARRGKEMAHTAFALAFDAEIIKKQAGPIALMTEAFVNNYVNERLAGGFEEQIYRNGMLLRDLCQNAWDVIHEGADSIDYDAGQSVFANATTSFFAE